MTQKQVHEYEIQMAERVAKRKPEKYTTIAGASKRIGKLFIDHLRNARGFTAVGACSPRVKAGLPVACPTTWDVVESGKLPECLTIKVARSRRR